MIRDELKKDLQTQRRQLKAKRNEQEILEQELKSFPPLQLELPLKRPLWEGLRAPDFSGPVPAETGNFHATQNARALRQSAKTKCKNEVQKWKAATRSVWPSLRRSKYLLSNLQQENPTVVGFLASYLTSKATIVALFARSKLFSSNFLKPSLASTSLTNADLVGSATFLSVMVIS